MSKKIQNATKTAKKVQKISAKKVIRQDEPKPLMTLEEAREVLKRHMAFDTEEGAGLLIDTARMNLDDAFETVKDTIYDKQNILDADKWRELLGRSAKIFSDAVECMIAAEINYGYCWGELN